MWARRLSRGEASVRATTRVQDGRTALREEETKKYIPMEKNANDLENAHVRSGKSKKWKAGGGGEKKKRKGTET